MNKITFELGDKQMAGLKAWANDAGLSPEELVREIIVSQIEDEDDFTAEERKAIEDGLAAIERGEVTPQAEVMAKARKIVDR